MPMDAPLQPWEKIEWSPEHERVIYRDWGLFYTHKQQLDKASYYYNKSLDIRDDDPRALYFRSKCKRHIAQTEGALVDSQKAADIYAKDGEPDNAPINLEVCDALYELNRFEDCKVELHDNTRLFLGKKVKNFLEKIAVVDENFNDSLGDSLGPFILTWGHIFNDVLREIRIKTTVDPRPLWKILLELGKCDVMSILEKEELILSPREVARRERAFKIFNQIYFNRSWIDVCFLKGLRENMNLLMPQAKVSTPFFRGLLATKYGIVKRFLKMLQARSPMYNEETRRYPNKRLAHDHRETYKYRVQYQTRRNMLTILRSVRMLRLTGKVNRLAKYIESVMGDYVVLKTYRVMPWKFEFINEIYNTLALAFTDKYLDVPAVIKDFSKVTGVGKERMLRLLCMPIDKYKERTVQFVFGDRSTFQEPDAIDYNLIAYKKFLSRLEKRMKFAEHGIERCYLLHEIARAHLDQSRFDECVLVARKAIDEAKRSNHRLWQFLSTMLIVKAHAVLHKIERGKEALDEAICVAADLKCQPLVDFVDICRVVNDMEISLKKRTQSVDSLKRRKSKASSNSDEDLNSQSSSERRSSLESEGYSDNKSDASGGDDDSSSDEVPTSLIYKVGSKR